AAPALVGARAAGLAAGAGGAVRRGLPDHAGVGAEWRRRRAVPGGAVPGGAGPVAVRTTRRRAGLAAPGMTGPALRTCVPPGWGSRAGLVPVARLRPGGPLRPVRTAARLQPAGKR